MDEVRILGAGLSGLSAAINLKKLGKDVAVYEMRKSVGLRYIMNFQGLGATESFRDYLEKLNINVKPKVKVSTKMFFCTRTRDLDLRLSNQGDMVIRGGEESLEHLMYEYAAELGIRFEFGPSKEKIDANIIATGPRRCDAAAVGAVFETSNFDNDRILTMFDDRYSPKGLYLYIIPVSKDRIEIINTATSPYVPDLKKLLLKAIEERKILRDIVDKRKPIEFFGGSINFDYPKTAVIDGRLYVGEAAGFQDAAIGGGMRFALESGKMAAESIVYNKNYDDMWKRAFTKRLKLGMAQRFVLSVLGDRAIDVFFKNIHDGDSVDIAGMSSSLSSSVTNEILFRFASVKKFLTNRWH